MAKVINKGNSTSELKPSQVTTGSIITWGAGNSYYLVLRDNTKAELKTGTVSGFTDDQQYKELRIVNAEVHVNV